MSPADSRAVVSSPEPEREPRRRVLLLSYVFPPVGGIMVQRVLSFARYLPDHQIDVCVLTCRNPATPVYDQALVGLVPPHVRVFRAFTPEPPFYLRKKVWALAAGRPSEPRGTPSPPSWWQTALRKRVQRVLSPDAQVLWAPFARRAAARLIARHEIDTVLVTAPPFSLFLVGNALKRRFPHLTLISDFRDEWLRFMLTEFEFMGQEATRDLAASIERETVELSDRVLAVTRSSLTEIRRRYPEQPAEKFAFVPNGFDPAVFQTLPAPVRADDRVVIAHVGTAYKTSTPRYFLAALDVLPPAIRARVEVRFIGRVAETEAELFRSARLGVRTLGFVPQAEIAEHLSDAQYLLLTMTNDFSLPGKLFEYLAMGRPILALSPAGGEVDRLISATGGGWCVPHTDPVAIGRALEEMVLAVDDPGRLPARRDAVISRFERPRVAADLASLIHGLA